MKIKLPVLAVAAAAAWALKRHYADASVEDLAWILQPTAQLVGLLTGTAFVAVPGEGYVSYARLFAIEKSCAGVNFMIAAFALVVLARLPRVDSWRRGAASIAASLAIGYGAAIVVNTLRITIALWLASRPSPVRVSAAQLHRLEGIVVYFVGLLMLYALVQRLERREARAKVRMVSEAYALGRSFRRAALPLGCYYGVTLILPLANGAGQSGRVFVEHALIVATVPMLLVVLVWSLHGSVGRLSARIGFADSGDVC